MPAPVETHKPIQIYQIKVMLRDSHPPIWLRIQVTSDTTLAKLHRILQRVMGWEDTHLHISTSSSSGTRATARLTRTTRDRARCGTNESTNWAVWSHRVDIEEDKKLSWAALRERWPLFYCERRLLGCPYKGPGDSRPFPRFPCEGFYDPYAQIRVKINSTREKFKEYKEFPCSLVLRNVNAWLVGLDVGGFHPNGPHPMDRWSVRKGSCETSVAASRCPAPKLFP